MVVGRLLSRLRWQIFRGELLTLEGVRSETLNAWSTYLHVLLKLNHPCISMYDTLTVLGMGKFKVTFYLLTVSHHEKRNIGEYCVYFFPTTLSRSKFLNKKGVQHQLFIDVAHPTRLPDLVGYPKGLGRRTGLCGAACARGWAVCIYGYPPAN